VLLLEEAMRFKKKKKDRCFCAALSLAKEQTGEYKRPCGSYCRDGGNHNTTFSAAATFTLMILAKLCFAITS
jgi:hypothetical protein